MTALIDLDVILYQGLFAVKDQGYFAGLRTCDNLITNVVEKFDSDYKLFLSGPENFRKEIYPEYKGHRKAEARPKYLYETKQYFKKYWNANESQGEEADDLIAQSITDDCVVVSNDHDFKQLGVPMFNPRTWELTKVDNPEFWFWIQMLTGCKTDSVPGLKNPAKSHFAKPPNFTEDTASVLLEGKSKEEMRDIVQGLYQQVHGDEWFEKYDTVARLIYLRRSPNDEYYNTFG